MALLKSITENNITANYWKVSIFSCTYRNSGIIVLFGYENQLARINENSKLLVKSFQYDSNVYNTWFSPTELDEQGSNPLKNSYLYIKSIPGGEFSDATDI